MIQSKLQLNSEKTEAMLIGTRQKLSSISVNTIQLDDTTVPLSDSVKKLGVLFDSTLSMENFISQTARSCYYQLCQISSVRKYFSTKATVKLVTSLLSHLDYCSSLLSGLPAPSVHSLHRIQNCAARLIPKNTHVKLILSHFCFNFSTGSQSNKKFSTR